jgi:hypothetical protein
MGGGTDLMSFTARDTGSNTVINAMTVDVEEIGLHQVSHYNLGLGTQGLGHGLGQ